MRKMISFMAMGVLLGAGTMAAWGDGIRADRMVLTWKEDPTTTMTIQWIEEAPLKPIVAGRRMEQPLDAVPYIASITIDGADDWWDQGLALEFLASDEHVLPAPDVVSGSARLAWNEEGLAVAALVHDPVAYEGDTLWLSDGIEIYVSDGVGSAHRYQVVITPGRTDEYPEPRYRFYQKRGGPSPDDLEVEVASQVLEDGYRLEAFLPWSNLPELDAQEGAEIGFQFYINDKDSPARRDHRWLIFFPRMGASGDASAKHTLRLAAEASAAVRGRAEVHATDNGDRVHIYAIPELIGATVTVQAGQHVLGEISLERDGHRAAAQFPLPAPAVGTRWGVLEVRDDDGTITWADTATAESSFVMDEFTTVEIWPADGDPTDAVRLDAVPRLIDQWTGMRRQRVHITGLTPATAYRFRAVGAERDFGFRTMPSSLERPLRIAVGGDTRTRQDWMERMNHVVMRYRPDFALWGGDLAYANGVPEGLWRWEEWFDAMYNTLIDDDGFVLPIVVAIGNHEVQEGYYYNHRGFEPTDEWRQRIAPYFYQFFAFPDQPGYGVLDFGDYLSVILLDSAHTNPVEGEQTEWLEQVLKERRDVPHVFPIYHVGAYPAVRPYDGRIAVSIREHWIPLFEKYGIEVAFENHDHVYKRTHPIRGGEVHPDGIIYMGDGAWGVSTRTIPDDERWYIDYSLEIRHAVILTLQGHYRHFAVISEHGELVDEYPATGLIVPR